jgi:hypothetical protein
LDILEERQGSYTSTFDLIAEPSILRVLFLLAACLIEKVSSDLEATSATIIAEALEEAQTRWNLRTLGLFFINGRSSGPCFLLRNPIQCEEK